MQLARIVLCLFLCGCVSLSDDVGRDQVAATPSLHRSTQWAIESGQFVEGAWPNADWWRGFEDEQLHRLVALALRDNPTMQRAQVRVQLAHSQAHLARAKLFPVLESTVETNWESLSRNGFYFGLLKPFLSALTTPVSISPQLNVIDLLLNFAWEIDFWGRNRKQFQALLGQLKTEVAEQAQAQLLLSISVAQAYFTWQMDLTAVDLLEQSVKAQEELLALVRSREAQGVANAIDGMRLEQSVFASQKAVVAMRNQIDLDLHLLKFLVGEGPDATFELTPPVARIQLQLAVPQEISLDLLARRPDLMAQIWRVESAAKRVGMARADFFPNINLVSSDGVESLQFNTLLKGGSKQGNLHPAIHIPLFTGGRLTANLHSKRREYDVAVYEYNEMLLRAVKEVADELRTVRSIGDELSLQTSTAQAAQRVAELASLRWVDGVDSSMQVLQARLQALAEQLGLLELRYGRYLAVLRLIKALGGGYHNVEPLSPTLPRSA